MSLVLKLLVTGILPLYLWAQYSGEPSDPQSNILRQEGKLINISIVRGEPLKIYVLGKMGAEISLSDVQLEVRDVSDQRKLLTLDRDYGYFVIKRQFKSKAGTDLEIKARFNNQEEKMLFKIPMQRP